MAREAGSDGQQGVGCLLLPGRVDCFQIKPDHSLREGKPKTLQDKEPNQTDRWSGYYTQIPFIRHEAI